MNIILILLLLLSATEGRCSSFQEILRSFEAMTVNNHASTGPQVVQRKAPPPVPPKPKNLRADAGSIPDAVNPFDNEDSDVVSELSVGSNPFDDCYECEPVQVQEKPSVLKAIHMFENLSTTGGSRRSMDEVKENPSVSESQCPSFIKGNVATQSNVAAKAALIGGLLKAGPLKQAPLSPKVPLVPVKANFARLDKRYERIENILNEIGETEAVFSEALALLLDLKIENLSLSESLSKSGVVDKKSKKTLDRSVSVLRRILQVSQNFQEGYSSLLVTNGPSSSSMDAIEDFLIQAMSSSEFQSSFSDYAFELLELNQIIIKIEAKKKGKKIHSQYIQEFNKELVQNSRRLCFINMGSVLILPIQRALKYELFVKELIKAKKEFDSIDRLSVLQEIIQDFASQTNQKLSPT